MYYQLDNIIQFVEQQRFAPTQRNPWFACICLAIFGIASRWSDDPRVLPEEVREKAKEDEDQGRNDIWSLSGWGYIAAAMSQYSVHLSRGDGVRTLIFRICQRYMSYAGAYCFPQNCLRSRVLQ